MAVKTNLPDRLKNRAIRAQRLKVAREVIDQDRDINLTRQERDRAIGELDRVREDTKTREDVPSDLSIRDRTVMR